MKIRRLNGIIFFIFAVILIFITTVSAIAGDLKVIGHRGARTIAGK